MGQSLCDLNDCITVLKHDSRFATMDISVVGHSWGGFAIFKIFCKAMGDLTRRCSVRICFCGANKKLIIPSLISEGIINDIKAQGLQIRP